MFKSGSAASILATLLPARAMKTCGENKTSWGVVAAPRGPQPSQLPSLAFQGLKTGNSAHQSARAQARSGSAHFRRLGSYWLRAAVTPYEGWLRAGRRDYAAASQLVRALGVGLVARVAG